MTESETKQHLVTLCEMFKTHLERTADLENGMFAIIATLRETDPRLPLKIDGWYGHAPSQASADERAERNRAITQRVNEVIARLLE